MAGVFAALLDKRSRAMRVARFRAWWEGEEFDEAAAAAAIEEALAAQAQAEAECKSAPPKPDAAEALFEDPAPPLTPRLAALQTLWGEGRVMPGDAAAEALQPARLGLEESATLAIVGAGLPAPVLALAGAHKGKCVVLEWREEARATLEHAVKHAKLAERVEVRAMDLNAFAADAGAFGGLISFDEFTYAADAPALAGRIAAAMKPAACIVAEAYAAAPGSVAAPAFAAAFAEPHLRTAGDLAEAITRAGFAIEANEDQTAEALEWAKAGFKRLEGALAQIAEQALDVRTLQEIAWEAAAWRARLKLMSQKRLERRQIVARKTA